MKQERIAIFDQGMDVCRSLLDKYPNNQAVISISRQIEYLIGLEKNLIADKSRLKEITIGVLTAREIEPLDDAAADLLHKVAGEARSMSMSS